MARLLMNWLQFEYGLIPSRIFSDNKEEYIKALVATREDGDLIYAPIVDAWSLYDNNESTTPIVERGEIIDNVKLSKIKESCLNKRK